MAKLPNPGNAVVETRKLHDYCLSHNHPRGRHKARVFSSALGLTAAAAGVLRERLLRAASSEDATPAEEEYGKRYVLDFEMSTETGTATVRSGEDHPRLTTCWVL